MNNVLPGATRTRALDQIAEAKAAKTGTRPAEVLPSMAKPFPCALGEAREIGAAIAFLVQPCSRLHQRNQPCRWTAAARVPSEVWQ